MTRTFATSTMIEYTTSIESIAPDRLVGFFVGWPHPPSPAAHLRILAGSDVIALAVDADSGNVVGFATAITDGVLAAYIPLLEVLPQYQRTGIGSTLVRMLLEQLQGLYMIDLACDVALQPFYVKLGLRPSVGMTLRNYASQSGRAR
jgi:ribosomal protein S18 acetylase RimI-like enzyme